MTKTTKTTYDSINTALEIFSNYFTVQDNEINQYARICFTDNFKKDNYKLFKDFAIYYDRKDSYKISIADSTLTDCKVFKESHEKTDKTKALEFAVKSDNLVNVIYEILAQRLSQSDKVVYYTDSHTATEKKSNRRSKKSEKTA